ncbi:DUF421 domain-containing protein [Hymenobacter sp. HSC-4F20]|uniref:DUF421 domain-containing protein n=1 Tax=Hymenobacter sp. HSC-4F20 TaxID=2864135 RepID=UPI001C72B3B1|nr:YetF domain-containing protein [Hymenobacter sp. HSC-4F20]MBX0292953.1 DUF421 domain-containing protein [Hymenobacter sp. HSC-4F20]
MLLAADIQPFDWKRLLISDTAPPLFLLEIAFRCVVTYLLVLGALRVTGRRGVRQLSIFELSIILALGSAAGDAMFYDDVPMLHVTVVFVVVSVLYLLFNWLTEHYPRFSDWLEGAPILLIENGEVKFDVLKNQNLTQKELFGELRQHQVEHLGQVRRAYMEATGNVSIYFFEDADVRPGLPIWPERLKQLEHRVDEAGPHACTCCGHVQQLPRGGVARCPVCHEDAWVPACTDRRVQ